MKKTMAFILAVALLAMGCGTALAEALGRMLPDFSVETVDGNTFTLSGALENHDAVLINLWATWCPPCEREFPYLEEAYEQYADRVAVIALSVEPNDTPEVLREYADAHGMTFPVGSDSGVGLADAFNVASIPTSIAVDRFGNVVLVEAGAQTSAAPFTALFDHLLDEAYTQTEALDGFPAPRPVEGASEAELSAAANAAGGTLTFRNPESADTWPMLPVEDAGRRALASANAGVGNSTAAVYTAVEAAEGDALAFDFRTSLEPACDMLYVAVDGVLAKRFSGEHEWTAWALPLSAGKHEVAFGCRKDAQVDEGEDRAWISNVRVASGAEAGALLAALPEYPVGEAFESRLVAENARWVEFDDPAGVVGSALRVDGGWMIDGERAAIAVTLSADEDPETAFVYVSDGSQVTLVDALKSGGYEVPVSVAEGTYMTAGAYPGGLPGEIERAQGYLLLGGESGTDSFIDDLADYGYAISWRYADAAGEADSEAAEATAYVVSVVDQNGEAVPGVYVNFCTDDTCETTQSDGNGVITFSGEPYAYHLQVLKVPEGYSFDGAAEIYTEDQYGALTLTVTKNPA